MKEHLSCCAGKAGFTFSFDNGKVIDYQDHYSNLGDVPFSTYFDFETTTGNVVFFHAKMYIVSYSIIVAFHPDLSLPRINIFRSCNQSYSSLMSLAHFFVLDFNFFDDPEIYKKTTLKELEAAALSVIALAEMFSVELKFTVDCLKAWFEKNHKIIEIDIDQKFKFIRENPIKKDSPCCLCDFPVDPKVENGWLDHVLKP